jgi:hypothetical protein
MISRESQREGSLGPWATTRTSKVSTAPGLNLVTSSSYPRMDRLGCDTLAAQPSKWRTMPGVMAHDSSDSDFKRAQERWAEITRPESEAMISRESRSQREGSLGPWATTRTSKVSTAPGLNLATLEWIDVTHWQHSLPNGELCQESWPMTAVTRISSVPKNGRPSARAGADLLQLRGKFGRMRRVQPLPPNLSPSAP